MEEIIRKLARSQKYQFLYAKVKELNNLRLFKNEDELSYLQIIFLYWLEIYHALYRDLAQRENYITEEVIEDDIRTDAYLVYRKKGKKEDKIPTGKKVAISGKAPGSVIFKRRFK